MNIAVERWKAFEKNNLLGFVDLRIGDALIVKCKLMKGANGNFLALPSVKKEDGKYDNLAYFVNRETSQEAIEIVEKHISGVVSIEEKPVNTPEDIVWED